MRTYSRKRIEHSLLENAMDVCRLCLEKPDEFVPIYSEAFSVFSPLALRILVCVGLEVSNNAQLPNKICTHCHAEIDKIYLFRKKCAKSYQKMKSHIQALKARETRKINLMFTINSEGAILLKDGNNSMFTGDEALVTLTKIVNDESKPRNPEVLIFNELMDKVEDQETQQVLIQSTAPSSSLTKEEITPEANTTSDPELSEFLSTMLTGLGILIRHGDGVIELGHETSRTLELETKDGKNISFELVEEDNDDEMNCDDAVAECVIENRITTEHAQVEVVSSDNMSGRCRKSAKCAECGKIFRSSGVLRRHERNVHKGIRPHACPTCGKKFAQKEVLTRHLFVHMDKRPFQCDKCSKSFTQRSALELHSRLHWPPQDRSLTLYKCHYCNKVFFHASGLSRHLLSHKSKRVSCDECGRSFSDKSSMRRHKKTMGHQSKEAVEEIENRTLSKIDSVQSTVQQDKPNVNESALSTSDTGG